MGFVSNTAGTASLDVGGTVLPALVSFSWTGAGQEAVEVTAFDTSANYREYVRGLTEPGEINFVCNYLPDNVMHDSATKGILFELTKTGASTTLTYTPPDGSETTTHTFPGILTSCEFPDLAPGEVSTISGTFKVTGAPTFDAS